MKMKCSLCPRRCNAERTLTENKNGYCRQSLSPRVARAALHFWEEPIISGKNGSGTVFFSGCNLGCIYCQNEYISRLDNGKIVTPERLSEIYRELENMGAHNINLVTPTHFITAIKESLDIYRPNIPIVYNSGGYESVETIKSLRDYVDIYLVDYKYIDPLKSGKYSFAADYPDIARKAIDECYRQKGEAVITDGIMRQGVIVRHLLLPRSTEDAIRIFDYVKDNMSSAYFSLMSQYVPIGRALKDGIINRKITKREYDKVVDHIFESGFQNCFIQERTSATDDYIPIFDNRGV